MTFTRGEVLAMVRAVETRIKRPLTADFIALFPGLKPDPRAEDEELHDEAADELRRRG